ncbi:putative DNA binding domain-containing protein [bacterium]|nr:putative DNA binding domain-containing protein [bacterium]
MAVKKDLFGEEKHIEFKAEMPKRHDTFLKDIVAFANTSGGKTIIGIADDTGEVIGIGEQNPFKLSDAISNMISDACTPHISTEINVQTLEGKTILEIEVFPGKQRPYYLVSKGKEASSYIRVNGTSRPATERKLKELELEGLKISYDTLPEIGVAFEKDKALQLCETMYQTALAACRSQEERDDVRPMTLEKLEDFGLLHRDGHELQITRGFTLLTKPLQRYVKIQCALFKGTVRDEFIDRKEFRGPIHEQLEQAHQFVLRHINMGAIIEGLYRRDVYELPTKSIREMIANAVLHRSYLDESSIQVSIYDDRLEIDSPGMLYDGLSVAEALAGKSRCRNTAIAEAFQYMKIIEGWGTGLPRLFERCHAMGLKEPIFQEFSDGIKVIIYRNAIQPTTKTTQSTTKTTQSTTKTTQSTTQQECPDISATEIDIINHILDNRNISQKEISLALGIGYNLTKYYIRRMKEKGLITRCGTPRRGEWLVKLPPTNDSKN